MSNEHITDEQIHDLATELELDDPRADLILFARAILALRPAAQSVGEFDRAPMTPACKDVIEAARTADDDALDWLDEWSYHQGWIGAEIHHGITTPKATST